VCVCVCVCVCVSMCVCVCVCVYTQPPYSMTGMGTMVAACNVYRNKKETNT